MIDFTDDELRFLARYGVSPEDVYDARGQAQWFWKERAKEEGRELVIGSGCRARGHRLRTRAGHCVQCDPKKLGYLRHHTSAGYVYIAGTLRGRLIKIGSADNPWQRLERLRAEKYGGFADWDVLAHVSIDKRGGLEDAVKA